MRFILIDQILNGDMFNKEFDTKEEAVKKASSEWEALSDSDKKRRESFYVIESVNPDEEAEDHFDGDIVWEAI